MKIARRIHMSELLIRLILLVAAIVVIWQAVPIFTNAGADTISWTSSGDPMYSEDVPQENAPIPGACTQDTKVYLSNATFITNDNMATVCQNEKPNWRFGKYAYKSPNSPNVEQGYAISFGLDTKMYRLTNFNPVQMMSVPGHNDIITLSNDVAGEQFSVFHSYTNIADPANHYDATNTAGVTTYTLNTPAPDFTLKRPNGTDIRVKNMGAVSENGKWMVLEAKNLGLLRLNVETKEVERFSTLAYSYGGWQTSPFMYLAISNDGKTAVATGGLVGFKVYSIDETCAESVTDAMSHTTPMQTPCAMRDYDSYIAAQRGPSYSLSAYPVFTDEAGYEIHFNPTGTTAAWAKLSAPGHNPLLLDYLALGDSYSSGEGDFERDWEGGSHYLQNSDQAAGGGIPENRCHISTRSYPFILRDEYNIDSNYMKSIACSGARVVDLGKTSYESYLGQREMLGSVNPELIGQYQNAAIGEFTPGYTEQIRFISRYKPRAVTLTVSGNDINFSGKLTTCASTFDTCDYVGSLRAMLGQDIREQYWKLVKLYSELKGASPQTKFYIIGYPSFVDTGVCLLNAGKLNDAEKIMMQEAVKYLNMVVRSAADATGMVYVDIENSLVGGRLCEGPSSYVTGLHDIDGLFNETRRAESFHPNARGQEKIAGDIKNQLGEYSLLSYPYNQSPNINATPPQPTQYFSEVMQAYSTSTHGSTYIDQPITKEEPHAVSIDEYTFERETTVTVTAYSEPITIGQFTTSTDGGLNASLVFPESLPAGYHTIIFSGKSYSGEPINFYETVIILGVDEADLDENNIPDNQQLCGLFLASFDRDSDLDGIDDACDPYIDPKPRPVYRLRPGDTSHTYQGSPENSSYVYLERNVYAISITGISGDYDSDGDGYAVIAATQNSTPSGRYANLDVDQDTIPNTIHISFRTPENGCVQYKPTDLSQVTETSDYRTFTQEITNTNTCRAEAVSDDLDEDGQPDNTQPLYTARNGDPSKGEVATKLYLFRNTRAAEAQLGVSDYAPNTSAAPTTIPPDDNTDYRQHTSLLVSTQSNPLLPVTYKSIRMIGNVPYVVVTVNTLGLCQVYKPASIDTIRQSTQNTTNLTLDLQQTLNAQLQAWCN